MIFKKHTINRAVMTKDSCYVVGTISDGIYALDKKGKLIWKVNTDNKLQNNTVLRLYCDDDNNIWTALDEGIAYIHNNSLICFPHSSTNHACSSKPGTNSVFPSLSQ